MKVFGLTGGIATGKSTVVEMFRELGARIIDADLLARKAVQPGQPAYRKIIEHFGEGILLPDGNIDREKLGAIVFDNESARRTLNSFTHPRVFELMAEGIDKAREDGVEVVIVDVPLLLESGAETWLKPVILVYADREAQLKRLLERNNCDEKRAEARINSQMPIDEKKKLADIVIDNTGTTENTRRQVKEIWGKISLK